MEVNNLVQYGRVKYLYTLRNGTHVAFKPDCCYRVFEETQLLNRKHTFKCSKAISRDEISYENLISKIKATFVYQSASDDILDQAFSVSNDVDLILKDIKN